MPKFKSYFELDLPREYKADERRAIAAEIIDAVISRTEAGLDFEGKKFAKYSKKYAKEKGQGNVDLTFSGQMLAAIELLQEKPGKIRIGIDPGSDMAGRAEGNVLGTYGNSEPVTKPRNFLGLTDKELRAILDRYPLDDKEERRDQVSNVEAAKVVAKDIMKRSNIDVEADDE